MPRSALFLMLLALVAAACGGPAPDPQHDVDIKATDGVALKGSYFSAGKPGPAIVLFHQCNMDRHAWDTLAGDLTAAGFHVLAVDQRGFGDNSSVQGRPDQHVSDDDAAHEYLLSRPDVDRQRIAAGGASCGVGQAIALSKRQRDVRALVLLSGFANREELAHLAATPTLPVFGAVSEYDSPADIRDLVSTSKHPNSTVKVYPGHWFDVVFGRGAHGVAIFGRHPDLRTTIVSWLSAQLTPTAADATRP